MIENKFNLQDKVKIIELGIEGVIVGIWVGNTGIEYKVRYIWQGIAYEVYFFDWEIKKES